MKTFGPVGLAEGREIRFFLKCGVQNLRPEPSLKVLRGTWSRWEKNGAKYQRAKSLLTRESFSMSDREADFDLGQFC